MKAKYESLNTSREVMDVKALHCLLKLFEMTIDEATMDSMFHCSMWDPPDDVRAIIKS